MTPPKVKQRKRSAIVILTPEQENEMYVRYQKREVIISVLAKEYGLTRGALIHRVKHRQVRVKQADKALKLHNNQTKGDIINDKN